MGNTVTNNHKSGDGAAVLGIVAVVAIAGIIATVIAMLTIILVGCAVGATAILAYKTYELHVHRSIALAAIQANMPPPPLRPERRIPPMRELTWGRDHA
jgi:uncharacterized membrane protein